MAVWVPRVGERAASQQYLAQWILALGALLVVAWIGLALLGRVAHSGFLTSLSVGTEVVSLALVAVGVVAFMVSRRNRTTDR